VVQSICWRQQDAILLENPAACADDGTSKATDNKQLDFAASLMPSSLLVADLMLSCISSAASWPVIASWTQTQLDS